MSTEQLLEIKRGLVERTRANLRHRSGASHLLSDPPRAKTRFVGRDVERRRLVEALRTERSVAISGVGGIGKTELLLQALTEADTGRPLLWIDVERFGAAAEVLTALRTALGRDGSPCAVADVPGRLDALQACLVFDGVERVALTDLDVLEEAIAGLCETAHDTQVVITTQVTLHGCPIAATMKIGKLDAPSSQAMMTMLSALPPELDPADFGRFLRFCDGHALTLKLGAALRDYYGGSRQALRAVEARGAAVVSVPGRSRHHGGTSLNLCLLTAYGDLSAPALSLIWALAEAPAGVFVHYIESGWLDLPEPVEALAELCRWHLVDIVPPRDATARAQMLGPVRAFIAAQGRDAEPDAYADLVDRLANGHAMMVAVLETRYPGPDATPYLVQRYGAELSNLTHVLDLAQADPGRTDLVEAAVSIAGALMRYFFVQGLPDQGVRVMRQAAELALASGDRQRASGLILQLIALASRAGDGEQLQAGLALADTLERRQPGEEGLADIAMSHAIACHQKGDVLDAELHAREALRVYQGLLRKALAARREVPDAADPEADDPDDLHNDISHAFSLIGSSLLAQQQYAAAGKAYRHSLRHQRGASMGLNRGQTLHQTGNCESHLRRYREAAALYREAAGIFNAMGMREYLSNAAGELGYALLDIRGDYRGEGLDEETMQAAIVDLEFDVGVVFHLDRPIDHDRASGMIRKTFGVVSLATLSGRTEGLVGFARRAADGLRPLMREVGARLRDPHERYPLEAMDVALALGFFAAQAQTVLDEEDDLPREIVFELLKIACNTDHWQRNVMRTTDWLAALLFRSWSLKGADRERLDVFIQNADDGIDDWIDLTR